jgi:hypothetical protein
MEALREQVLLCLRQAKQPLQPQQISHALGARVYDVYDELGYLVRHGAANRHHYDDAVLRYSLTNARAVARVLRAEPIITPHQKRPRVSTKRPAPMAEAVLAVMGAEPMSFRAITTACAGRFSVCQVANLLQVLKHRGAVKKLHGTTCGAKWQRVTPTQQARP